MLLLPPLLLPHAFVPLARSLGPPPCCRRGSIHLGAAEDEAAARQRWLASRAPPSGGAPSWQTGERSSESEIASRQREREEARKRMLDAMGGDPEQLRSGQGVMFGYGAPDDEYYGYGERNACQMEEARKVAEAREARGNDNFTPDWLSRDLTEGGKPFDGGGFDGRLDGWARRAEAVDPNPPPMANTIRAPRESSVPAQAYVYDLHPDLAPLPPPSQPSPEAADETSGAPPWSEAGSEVGSKAVSVQSEEAQLLDSLRRAME